MRVAFVGNSYTYFNDLPTMLATIAVAAKSPVRIIHDEVTPGGSSIFGHADPSTEAGMNTSRMLADPQGWNYVVLQDQSQTPGGGRDGDSGDPPGAARQKSEEALREFFAPRLTRLQATPVLYSTWGRHDGDPLNADLGYGNFLGMTAKTTAGYKQYSDVLQQAGTTTPIIVPAGRAFELVYNATAHPLANGSTFSCLYHHAGFGEEAGAVEQEEGPWWPQRPYKSRAHERDGRRTRSCALDVYGLGGHPSPLGTYLIACTFVAAVLGRSPVGIAWAPPGVTDAQREQMQAVARAAVFGSSLEDGFREY